MDYSIGRVFSKSLPLTCGLVAWLGAAVCGTTATAAVFSVSYQSASLEFEGTIDTATDRMILTSWKAKLDQYGSKYLTVDFRGADKQAGTVDDFKLSFAAMRPADYLTVFGHVNVLSPDFDIPDQWDRTIGAGATGGDWMFVTDLQTQLIPYQNEAGLTSAEVKTLIPDCTRLVWAGNDRGQAGTPRDFGRVPVLTEGNITLDDVWEDRLPPTIAAVPEPGSALLAFLGLAAIARRRRQTSAC